ncbi:MAG: cysteine synthase A [Pseudomonadales bacterium]|jgi:cysteine synthase A|nr:cysteine synthase A [Pseudomonadales bacterium]
MTHALFDDILGCIGNTPLVRIRQMNPNPTVQIYAKLEGFNPTGSIKDRIALRMIRQAGEEGKLRPGKTIIEATSGNTGIGLALVAAVKGYRLILTMPESMSVERRQIMKAYGAEIVLTPREKGMGGAIEKAQELLGEYPGSWMPSQFTNPVNVQVHRDTTAQEILRDFPDGFDYLITGVGTGGHISGCAEVLKARFPKLKVLAVEPEKSQVIAGKEKGLHRIQGIGAGFVPEVLDTKLLDGTIAVSEEAAFDMARRCAREEGVFVGISSGATLAALAQKLPELPEGSRVLIFCYDTGERYLSIGDLFPAG